jgi:histidinol phosphatase-like PHP family hydrolase
MKIDLHVHTVERSACANALEDEQIVTAIDRGLDALVFTNHECLVPLERLEELNRVYAPFHIFGGVEITVREREDLLVLGIHDAALESHNWTYPALHSFVREKDGWIALAHPFRFGPRINLDLERYPPDALEVCSINTPLLEQARIREIAARLGAQTVCNSDAHSTRDIGAAYNRLKGEPVDDRELIELLRNGEFLCVCGLN